ncbi:MAG: hypothetical protein GC205_10705 [Bacteroidetes bacterium]|nr:hypothetical protein [Bacteroidota bacterium]
MKYMMMLAGLLALAPLQSFAQSSDIRVVVAPEVEAMVAEHIRINQESGVVAGYRVQVYGNAVLSRSRDVKATVEMTFPDLDVQVVLEEPDFKVVIGNYLDRFDAYRDLQRVLPQFPGAFLVRQIIPISEL